MNNKIVNRKTEIFIILLLSFLLFFLHGFVESATIDELRSQIVKITETKDALEKEIAVYEKELKDIGEQSITLKNTIKSLDATIKKNSLDIKLTQNNIESTELEIEELSLSIDKNIDKINDNTKALSVLISEINKNDQTNIIENLLKYKNLSKIWNLQQNMDTIKNEVNQKIIDTKNTKQALETNKTKTEKKKNELVKLKLSLLDKKKSLDLSKKEKNQILIETNNSEAKYKAMLAEKKALADAFEKELEMFESELKYAIDPSSILKAGNGILSWPLKSIHITSRFGPRWGRMHNGVDFRAPVGTEVKTTLSGIVRGVGDTDLVCKGASLGKWIFIEHNNGLSTAYAHLSSIEVKVGQIVTTGEVIGFSGNTGASTGPHLHLSVYASQGVAISSYKINSCGGNKTLIMPVTTLKGAHLDPLQYLPSL